MTWCESVNSSNLILPAGDVRIGSKDFNIYANSQFPDAKSMNAMPLKSVGNSSVLVADIGKAEDSGALQYNIVRIDGQRSVYVPIFKQGGNSNTITIVNGIKAAIKKLVDIPESLKTAVVFDQSVFVKLAISNVVARGGHRPGAHGHDDPGLSGQPARHGRRAAVGSALDGGVPADHQLHGRLHQHHDSGRPGAGVLAAHRQRRHRAREHLPPHGDGRNAAGGGGARAAQEVSMAVLAATFTTSIVFFPVTFFHGVSKYIFTPLALGVVLSIFASYFFAMTVVPLYCAKFIRHAR